MKKLLTLCFALLLMVIAANAAILRVNPNGTAPYTTILAAYNAAVNGDTIVVAPGNYGETILSNKRLRVIGAGWDQVSMRYWYFNSGATGSSIEGIKLETQGGEYPCYSYASDSVTVRRCFLKANYFTSVWAREASVVNKWITFEDCVMIAAQNNGANDCLAFNQDSCVVRNCYIQGVQAAGATLNAFVGNPRFLTVTNCIFTNWAQLFATTGTYGLYYANNIVHDWNAGAVYGTYSPTGTFEYNASATITPPGTNATLLAGDPFVNYDETANYVDNTTDLHVTAGSNLIDTGVPTLLDRNGSRSDHGIYGGPYQFVENGVPAYPFVISIVAPSAIISGDSLNVNTIGRVGPRY